jgi:hypothetical protein
LLETHKAPAQPKEKDAMKLTVTTKEGRTETFHYVDALTCIRLLTAYVDEHENDASGVVFEVKPGSDVSTSAAAIKIEPD